MGADKKTRLITGCSSGIGQGIARAVLEKGDNAVITARDASKLSSNPFDQKGDPQKAGRIIVREIEREDYPHMILLGGGCTDAGAGILEDEMREILRWKEIGDSADFDQ